jgi:hypothetical protein
MTRFIAGLRTRRPGAGRRSLLNSGLFDGSHYLQAYPDVRTSGMHPLDHFMLYGWREGRDPNAVFKVTWYLSNNPDVARTGINPLLHYLRRGEREGRPVSPGFSPGYYAKRYADVARAPGGLLAHYLAHGRAEGRSGAPDPAREAGAAVTDADLVTIKPFADVRRRRVALLVCHAAGGRLKPHVSSYARGLAEAGYAVGLIACTDAPFQIEPDLIDRLDAVYLRANGGWDFAAWAHLLRVEPSLFAASNLLLADDSVLPRAAPMTLKTVLGQMEATAADLVGLTDSYEAEWHVQSYFLLLKPRALASIAFQRFILSVRALMTRDAVIGQYEMTLASTLRAAGLSCTVLYPSLDRLNPTTVHWKALLARGFPFLKLAVLQNDSAAPDLTELQGAGFDLKTAERLRMGRTPPARVATRDADGGGSTHFATRSRPRSQPLKVDFIGSWTGDSAAAILGRRLVEAWWRTGLPTNMRPSPGSDGFEIIDFDGPADIAVVQLTNAGPPRLTSHLDAVVSRAAIRIGICVDGCEPAWPGADALWALSDVDDLSGEGDDPLIRLPKPGKADPDADAEHLAQAMIESLEALVRDSRAGAAA